MKGQYSYIHEKKAEKKYHIVAGEGGGIHFLGGFICQRRGCYLPEEHGYLPKGRSYLPEECGYMQRVLLMATA